MESLLQKSTPTTIHNFSYVNNEHFKLIKLLKAEKKTPIIVTGETGIGKTTFVNLVAQFLKYDVIEIDFMDLKASNIKSLQQTCKSYFDNKEKIIVVDNVDIHNTERPEKLFSCNSRIIFITINMYDSFLARYKNECNIVNLRMAAQDVYKVISHISEKHDLKVRNDNIHALIENHGSDIRSIINDLQLKRYNKDRKAKLVCHKSIFKATTHIFTENIRLKCQERYFKFLGDIYDTFRDKIFNMCYENYCSIGTGYHMSKIAEVLSIYSFLPFEYKFVFLDLVNKHCRSTKANEIKMYKKGNISASARVNSKFYKVFDHYTSIGSELYLIFEYFKIYLANYHSGRVDISAIKDTVDMYSFLKDETVNKILESSNERKSRVKKIDAGDTVKKFIYKYSDGVSANARIDVKFTDLFK